jgi:lipopolysaccharide transport system ATP-binding protein
MPPPAVRARELSKSYPVYRSPFDRLAALASPRRRAARRFAALQSISFELPAGGGLGLIGETGAGKSTLLKLVAGVTQPTSGEIRVQGRAAAILELGAGFHPDFTGRQNIELNAAMLGLEPDEVRARLPAIVDFAEVGEFIDRPVRQYSSGMAMRLAFAIASQVDPEVLIVDEALAVGDGYFQKKCMDRILAFRDGGGSLLFCSHALYYVAAYCERAIWLRNGRVEAAGETRDVVQQYEAYLLRREIGPGGEAAARAQDRDAGAVASSSRITRAAFSGGTRGSQARSYAPLAPWVVELEWVTDDPARRFQLGVGVDLESGLTVAAFSTKHDGIGPISGALRYRARLEIPSLPLLKGIYRAIVYLADEEALHVYDRRWIEEAFSVDGEPYSFGLLHAEHGWQVESAG